MSKRFKCSTQNGWKEYLVKNEKMRERLVQNPNEESGVNEDFVSKVSKVKNFLKC